MIEKLKEKKEALIATHDKLVQSLQFVQRQIQNLQAQLNATGGQIALCDELIQESQPPEPSVDNLQEG